MERRIWRAGYKFPVDDRSCLGACLAGDDDVVRAQVCVNGDDGYILDDGGNFVQVIVDKAPNAIQELLFVFLNALLLFEGDEG